MFFLTIIVFCFTFFNILVQTQSFFNLPSFQENDIVETETGIRNTVNKLFSTLKIQAPLKPKWRKFIKIHEHFYSVTLQDYENLKEISRLVQVKNIENSIQIFIRQLNEILSKDNKSDETTDAVYITLLIQTFLEGLEHLKETYGVKSNVTDFDINKTILKILESDETSDNTTSECESKGTNTNVTQDLEYWKEEGISGRRVFKGRRASIKDYPFMASIQFFNKFQCAGSVIKTDLIITSGSCVQLAHNNRLYRENPAFLSVMVGSRFFEIGKETIPIMEIYFHPNYNPKTLKHNLAIIRLLRHIKLRSTRGKVQRIIYDKDAWPLPMNVEGVTIVGWGAREAANTMENPWTNRLSYAVLDPYPLDECQEIYTKEFVTDRNFCAGFFSKGGGACNHDAGGPGVMNSILVGVVSFGSPLCGAADAPTVFTKLGYYAQWIDEIMEQKSIHQRRTTTLRPERSFVVPKDLYETTTFIVNPFTKTTTEAEEEPQELPPVKELDQLRTLEQRERFNNFLKTIFETGIDFNDITVVNSDIEALSDELDTAIRSEDETTNKQKEKSLLKPDTPLSQSISKINMKIKSLLPTRLPTTQLIDVDETDAPLKYTRVVNTPPEDGPEQAKATNQSKMSDKSDQRKVSDKELENIVAKLVNQIKEEESLKLRESKKRKGNKPSDSEDYKSEESNIQQASRGVNDTVRELLRLVKKINQKEKYDDGNEDNAEKLNENEKSSIKGINIENRENFYIKDAIKPATDSDGDEFDNTVDNNESEDSINENELENYLANQKQRIAVNNQDKGFNKNRIEVNKDFKNYARIDSGKNKIEAENNDVDESDDENDDLETNDKLDQRNIKLAFEKNGLEIVMGKDGKKLSPKVKIDENSNDEVDEQDDHSIDESAPTQNGRPEVAIDREKSEEDDDKDSVGISIDEANFKNAKTDISNYNNTERLVELMSKSKAVYELLSKVVEEQ